MRPALGKAESGHMCFSLGNKEAKHLNETLIFNQHTNTYEGYSPTQRKHISIAAAAMAAAGQIGRRRADKHPLFRADHVGRFLAP